MNLHPVKQSGLTKNRRATFLVRGSLVLLALLLVLAQACSGKKAEGQTPPPSAARPAVPVVVAPVVEKAVPVQLTNFGAVEPYATIQVKAQIGGELTRVSFKEGQEVKKGDLLFTIDPRPYEAALKQAQADLDQSNAQVKMAQANLAKDVSQAKNADADLARYASVVSKGAVSKDVYDKAATTAEVAHQTVHADEAAVENARQGRCKAQVAIETAKLNLGYCAIRSPIDGRTGSLMANEGNLIKANADTAMVVINRIVPIYVTFSLPEQYLPKIKRAMAEKKLQVQAFIPHEDKPAVGELTFLDNQVDLATRTIKLKGTFPNQDRPLWPGQFVNVALTLSVQANAVVAPAQAIQTGQNESYAFVVRPDLTAEFRPVVAGQPVDGEVVVEKGLKPGEKVVIDGQSRLTPGAKVEIKD